MNNEIKEKQLKEVLYGLDYVGNKIKNDDGKLELGVNNCKLLLDYITNLQQENKRLQQNNYDMQREMAMCWQKIDKAIEYIKKHIQKYDIDGSIGDFDEFDILTQPNYLLNILQNGSDDNECRRLCKN